MSISRADQAVLTALLDRSLDESQLNSKQTKKLLSGSVDESHLTETERHQLDLIKEELWLRKRVEESECKVHLLDEHIKLVLDQNHCVAMAKIERLDFVAEVKGTQTGIYGKDKFFVMTVEQFFKIFLTNNRALVMQLLTGYPGNTQETLEKGGKFYTFATGAQRGDKGLDDSHHHLQLGDFQDFAKRQVAAFMSINDEILKDHGKKLLAFGVVRNNPQFGKGGEKQIVISCPDLRKALAENIKLFRNTRDSRPGKVGAMVDIHTQRVECISGQYQIKSSKTYQAINLQPIELPAALPQKKRTKSKRQAVSRHAHGFCQTGQLSSKYQRRASGIHMPKRHFGSQSLAVEQQDSQSTVAEQPAKQVTPVAESKRLEVPTIKRSLQASSRTTTSLLSQLPSKVKSIKNPRVGVAGLFGLGVLALVGGSLWARSSQEAPQAKKKEQVDNDYTSSTGDSYTSSSTNESESNKQTPAPSSQQPYNGYDAESHSYGQETTQPREEDSRATVVAMFSGMA